MIACFEIDGNGRVREVLQVNGQDFLRDVVVVQLVVAESHVDVQGQVLAVVQQDALVDVNRLLKKD